MKYLYTVSVSSLGYFTPEIAKRIWYRVKNGKVNPCTGTEALYRPYGPWGE